MGKLFQNTGKKKLRCFVCGRDFNSYEEFKEHIIDEHEEGREYLMCGYCGAPVRDVRLHYKVKHPGVEMPKDGQMRATVWYDFSGKRKKPQKKVPNFKEGYHASPKNNFQAMHYRSGYEKEVYTLLDEYNDVDSYEVEPQDCVTEYYWDGKMKKYHPDLKVRFKDGRIEVWEIKPSNQTDYPINTAKWDSCAKNMGQRGWTFSVKTEQGIERLKRKVKSQKDQSK
jgi:hypothetical protein